MLICVLLSVTVFIIDGLGVLGLNFWALYSRDLAGLLQIGSTVLSVKFILLPTMDIFWGWVRLQRFNFVFALGGRLGRESNASMPSIF